MPDKIGKRSRAVGSPRPPRKTAAEKLAEKAAKEAAKKAAQEAKSTAITPTQSETIAPNQAKNQATNQTNQTSGASLVPGLAGLAVSEIPGKMPSDFKIESFKVTDSLNPPTTLPQASDSEFKKKSSIYSGAINAVKLHGFAYDLSKETFITEGKKADAFGAGIRTATKFEKVKGEYYDYQTQLQTNSQKETALGVAQHTTTQGKTAATYSNEITDQKLEQLRIASESAKAKTREKQSELDEVLKQLGEESSGKAA